METIHTAIRFALVGLAAVTMLPVDLHGRIGRAMLWVPVLALALGGLAVLLPVGNIRVDIILLLPFFLIALAGGMLRLTMLTFFAKERTSFVQRHQRIVQAALLWPIGLAVLWWVAPWFRD